MHLLTLLSFSLWPFLNFVYKNISSTRDFFAEFVFCFAIFIISTVTFMVAKRILKSQPPERLAAAFSLSILAFFSFKLVHDGMKLIGLNTSVTITWLGLSSILIVVAWKCIYNKARFKILTVFGGSIFLSSLAFASFQFISEARIELPTNGAETVQPKVSAFEMPQIPISSPNVYYILVDGYARSDTLTKYTGFDNLKFSNFLRERHFKIIPQAHANYFTTAPSVSSLFKMDYNVLDGIRGDYIREYKEWFRKGDNSVFRTFQKLNYRIFVTGQEYYCSDKVNLCIRNESLFSRGTWSFFWNTPAPALLHWVAKDWYRSLAQYSSIVLDGEVISATNKSRNLSKRPFFLFVHLFEVHDTTFDETCKRREIVAQNELRVLDQIDRMNKSTKKYVGSVKCMNRKLETFINQLKDTDPNAIIVIGADHGTSFSNRSGGYKIVTDELIRERLAMFNAWHLPEACRNHLPDNLSFVNHFRIIFSCITGENPNLLKNRYFSGWKIQDPREVSAPSLGLP
jgi:hypothetical protein